MSTSPCIFLIIWNKVFHFPCQTHNFVFQLNHYTTSLSCQIIIMANNGEEEERLNDLCCKAGNGGQQQAPCESSGCPSNPFTAPHNGNLPEDHYKPSIPTYPASQLQQIMMFRQHQRNLFETFVMLPAAAAAAAAVATAATTSAMRHCRRQTVVSNDRLTAKSKSERKGASHLDAAADGRQLVAEIRKRRKRKRRKRRRRRRQPQTSKQDNLPSSLAEIDCLEREANSEL